MINRLREPTEEETQRAIEHLETGYPELWKIWIERKGYVKYSIGGSK